MQFYSLTEFENEVFANANNIDFVAKCITPWHLIGIKAFIAKLLEENKRAKGYIYIKYHGVSGYVIKEDDLNFPEDSDITVIWGKKSEKKTSKQKREVITQSINFKHYSPSNQKKVFILNAFYPDYPFCARFIEHTGINCVPVCIDEGVGTYKTRRDLFGERWRRNKKRAIISEIQKLLETHIGKRIPEKTVYFTIFNVNKSGMLNENTDVTRYYRKVLSDSVSTITISDKPYILLLTQPFELKEEIAAQNEVNAAFNLVAKRYREAGFYIFVKPHPREKKEMLDEYKNSGYTLIDQSMPIERMLNCLTTKPNCVIGALSTALVTSSVLCNIPAISIARIVASKASPAYRKQVKTFEKRYGNVVSFIEK